MSSEGSSDDRNIALCPTCKKTVPIMQVDFKEGELMLQIQCTCTEGITFWKLEPYLQSIKELNKAEQHNCDGNSHGSINAEKYCAICQKWMCKDCLASHKQTKPTHVLLRREVNLSCSTHKSELKDYCNDCKQSICEKCTEHQDHNVTKPSENNTVKAISQSCEGITAFTDRNDKDKIELNQWIGEAIKQLETLSEEVNDPYQRNKELNLQLKELCLLMKDTAQALGDSPNYPLSKSVSSLKVTEDVGSQLSSTALIPACISLRKHFLEHYALVLENTTAQPKPKLKVNKHTYKCLKLREMSYMANVIIQLSDGTLATGHNNGKIKLWTEATFKCTKAFEAHTHYIDLFLQLKDGRLLSVAGSELAVWDITAFKCLKRIKCKEDFEALVQLQDGRLVSGGNDNKITVWDVATFESPTLVKGHSKTVKAFIQLPDGRLASSSEDSSIRLWDVKTMECLKPFEANNCSNHLFYLQDGRLLSSGEKTIEFWDLTTFKSIKSIEVHKKPIQSIHLLPDSRLAIGGVDFIIKLWDTSLYRCVASLETYDHHVVSMCSLNNGLLVSISDDDSNKDYSYLQKWDV